jgi:hypothetical protein
MIVLKALAKDPDDRFQNAEEMSKALEKISEQLSADERPIVPPPGNFSQQAVFSGTSRKQITDHRFADADTDAGIKPIKSASQPDVELDSVFKNLLFKLTDILNKLPIIRISTSTAIFMGLALYLFINFALAFFSTLSGSDLIERAWPIQLFLFASFLSLIGWGSQKWGLMIPSGMFFGTALIMAYCSLTGRWNDWAFLWMVELVVIWASIQIPIRIARIPDAGPVWARTFGLGMTILCAFLSTLTIFLSFIIAL